MDHNSPPPSNGPPGAGPGNSTPMMMVPAGTPLFTLRQLNHFVLEQYPTIAVQMITLMECLRTVPAEVQMYARAYKRGGLNAAETLFILIKYSLLLAVITDSVLQDTSLPQTPAACYALGVIDHIFTFITGPFVATALAWRCYVIYGLRRNVGRVLVILLLPHLAIAIWCMWGQFQYDSLVDGVCAPSPRQLERDHHKPFALKSDGWLFIYSILFDWTVTVASSLRLIKATRGPTGFARIGRILFRNNVHYLIVVSATNTVVFILGSSLGKRCPPLMLLSVTIIAICGMNLIISEQEAVYNTLASRDARTKRTSQLPTYPKGGDSSGAAPFESTTSPSTGKPIPTPLSSPSDTYRHSKSFMASGASGKDRCCPESSAGLASDEVYVISAGGQSEFEKYPSVDVPGPLQPLVTLRQNRPTSALFGGGAQTRDKPGSIGGISIKDVRASMASQDIGHGLPSRPASCYIAGESFNTPEEECSAFDHSGHVVAPRPRAHLRRQASLTIQSTRQATSAPFSDPATTKIVSPAPTFGRYPLGEQHGSTSTLGPSPLASSDVARIAPDRPSDDGSRVSSSSRSATDAEAEADLDLDDTSIQHQHQHHLPGYHRSHHLASSAPGTVDSSVADELDEDPSELPSLVNSANHSLLNLSSSLSQAHAMASSNGAATSSSAGVRSVTSASIPIVNASQQGSRTSSSTSYYPYRSHDLEDVEAQRPRTHSPHAAGIDEYVDADEDETDTY